MPEPFVLDSDANRLIQVGNICHQWSTIEYYASIAVWSLLILDQDTGAFVTGGLDLLPRLNMGISLNNHLDGDPRLTKALSATRTAIQGGLDVARNRAVHGVWFGDGSDGAHRVEVHRGRGGRQRHSVTGEELASTGKNLNELLVALSVVLNELGISGRFPDPDHC